MALNLTPIDIRGLTLDVAAGGPEDGPAVLLLHGFPQHAGEWDQVVPSLHAAGLRTYALNQRGYSPGARPAAVEDYRVAECVADALAVLDAVNVDVAHVVGHDWGAMVAWVLAAGHPDRVRTLTAVSVPHPAAFAQALATDADQRERSSYMQLFRQPGTAEQMLLADDAAALRGVFAGLGAERINSYVEPMREPGALTAALNWYRAMSLDEVAGPVTVPTTYVWSDGDVAVGRTAAEACAAHVTGDYRFVALDGVTHWIPDEAPDAVAEAVLARIAD
ncbi:Pimeloyl-ACP methyl ester carboxylesterase [Actinopolymorpha cephalotaxi]|uniref:Pimeloyl-ACP methyl ester carboxylesterase n=1 Tax=Actinopolymorpha cephalotaxi TaxID=504797 RepID=A0A1I3A9E0_9ACTN|nr:alpha/beta hydrolase [Actinopolymorpha cephalotaxi]NYH85274.1 pimeloyl-ACP methyl ester carboxylesterase [Actinopolymorpha cephalotaxi]SFH46535.1 Pimeloyl-ACP methyl ester carboxylesterase [Actinopolymorpha cephalotaxi]